MKTANSPQARERGPLNREKDLLTERYLKLLQKFLETVNAAMKLDNRIRAEAARKLVGKNVRVFPWAKAEMQGVAGEVGLMTHLSPCGDHAVVDFGGRVGPVELPLDRLMAADKAEWDCLLKSI